ncbi:MAG: hypothetical protein WCI18_13220 [Pseudomonadota bacterium]
MTPRYLLMPVLVATLAAAGCNSDQKKIGPKAMGGSSDGNPSGPIILKPAPEPQGGGQPDFQIPDDLSTNWNEQISSINTAQTDINARLVAAQANIKAALDNLKFWDSASSDQDKEVRELMRTVVMKHHCTLKSLELENHENDLRKAELEAYSRGDVPALGAIQDQITQLLTVKATCERLSNFMASERPFAIDTSFVYTGTIEALDAKKALIEQRKTDLAADLGTNDIVVLEGEITLLKSNLAALSAITDTAATITSLQALKASGSVKGADLTALNNLITSLTNASAAQTLINTNITNLKALLATKQALLDKTRGSSGALDLITTSLNAEKDLIDLMKQMYRGLFG